MNKQLVNLMVIIPIFWICLEAGDNKVKQSKYQVPDKLVISKNTPALEAIGMDAKYFPKILKYANKLPRINSLLIAKNNFLVVEKYYRGFNREKVINIKSINKIIISALVGIAIQKKYLKGIEQKIYSFFPSEMKSNRQPNKKKISIRNLITMTSGLESTSFSNIGAWVSSPNWVKYKLNRKLIHKPGTTFSYSTGNTHLLSALLTKATGMSTLEFAGKHLFQHMGIREPDWQKDPQGIYYGGNNMSMTPLDLMKIGVLYLNKGTYEGKQLLSEKWVKESTQFHANTDKFQSPLDTRGYGYLWWLLSFGSYKHYAAWGYGGQFIFIKPDMKLVVVITSQLQGASTKVYYQKLSELMEIYILPAVGIRRQSIPRELKK